MRFRQPSQDSDKILQQRQHVEDRDGTGKQEDGNLSPAIGQHELVKNDSCCDNTGQQGWMLRSPSELILAPILQSRAATRASAQNELGVYTDLMRQN